MIYHFDNPPSRESIVQEFDIIPDRLHRIETFIEGAAASMKEDDFDSHKSTYSMPETAFILKMANMVEVFALLCAFPRHRAELIVIFPPAVRSVFYGGPLKIEAKFDQLGNLVEWADSLCLQGYLDLTIGGDLSPDALIQSEGWVEKYESGSRELMRLASFLTEDSECSPVVTVCRSYHSKTQWRRKFLAERWYDALKPSERLSEGADLAAWQAVGRTGVGKDEFLEAFLEWAAGRNSWDGFWEFQNAVEKGHFDLVTTSGLAKSLSSPAPSPGRKRPASR